MVDPSFGFFIWRAAHKLLNRFLVNVPILYLLKTEAIKWGHWPKWINHLISKSQLNHLTLFIVCFSDYRIGFNTIFGASCLGGNMIC